MKDDRKLIVKKRGKGKREKMNHIQDHNHKLKRKMGKELNLNLRSEQNRKRMKRETRIFSGKYEMNREKKNKK